MNVRIITQIIVFASATFSLRAQEPPAPWKHQDIGTAQVGQSAEIAGSAKHADGVFTVAGTMDMWAAADGCHFVWRPVTGDAVLVARVVSMDNPGGVAHAKASVCIRESSEGGSRCVTQCTTPGDGAQFTYREKTDDKTVRVFPDATNPAPSLPKGTFPCWLKLVRRGNEFSGYESADGEKWLLTGTIKLDFKADAFIGITSSSHTKTTLTTSVFDHVKLSKPGAGAGMPRAKNRIARLTSVGIADSENQSSLARCSVSRSGFIFEHPIEESTLEEFVKLQCRAVATFRAWSKIELREFGAQQRGAACG